MTPIFQFTVAMLLVFSGHLAFGKTCNPDMDEQISVCSLDLQIHAVKKSPTQVSTQTETEIKFFTKPKTVCECLATIDSAVKTKDFCPKKRRAERKYSLTYNAQWFYRDPANTTLNPKSSNSMEFEVKNEVGTSKSINKDCSA